MLIDEFLNYISKEKKFSIHTQKAYESDLNEFALFLEQHFEISLTEANHKIIRTWFASLLDFGLAPRTIHRKASTLKSFYKYLLSINTIESTPMDLVPLPKLDKKLPAYVEEVHMEELLNDIEFSEDFNGYRDKLIIDLFYQTGIRRAELIGLKLKDVNLTENQIKVLGKRNKERIIPISHGLSETIKQYLTYRIPSEVENLFVTSKGKQLYPKLVYKVVNDNLSKVTTLSKKSPHILRHSFATHMLNHGAELNSIKELLGHVDLSATQVYTHNSMEKLKSIYKQAHPRA